MNIRRWPLWLQLSTVILGLSLAAAIAFGELVRTLETDYLRELLRDESRYASLRLSQAMDTEIRAGDFEALSKLFEREDFGHTPLHSARVQNADGDLLAYWSAEPPSHHSTVMYFSAPVELPGAAPGRLRLGWQSEVRLGEIESHVDTMRLNILLATLGLGAIVVAVAHFLAVRPIDSIARRLDRLMAGKRVAGRSSLTWFSAGEIERLEASTRELTRYRDQLLEAQTSLKRARDDAEAANVAKSQFLAKMSHEIRTPINGVIGNLDLLSGTGLNAENRALLSNAQRAAHVLLTLLNQVLDFTRLEAGRLDLEHISFSLEGLVDDTAQTLAGLIDYKRVALVVDLRPGLPDQVVGDPTRLRQVLMNLLSNAVKFTGVGEVVVSVERLEEGIRIEVRDTGPGIASEHQAKLFSPFVQEDSSTTRRFGGTGLGLSISHELVELMGGRIGLESKPGQGCVFWTEIPLVVSGPPTVLGARLFEGVKALVLSKQPSMRAVIARYTESFGLDVVACDSVRSARAQAEGAGIVVVDVNGEVTARHVKALGIDAPSVWLVPPGARVDLDSLHDSTRTVLKPVRRAALRNALSGLLTDDVGEQSVINLEPIPTNQDRIVLVVDDNLDNRMVASAMLKRLGIRADEANNGVEAVRCVERRDYDVVLMDEQMPVLDGIEATRKIRAFEHESGREPVPIIALTASALEGDEQRCLDAGMDAYLAKPIRRRTLGKALVAWMPELEPD